MRLTNTTSCEKGIEIVLVDDPKHMYMYHYKMQVKQRQYIECTSM